MRQKIKRNQSNAGRIWQEKILIVDHSNYLQKFSQDESQKIQLYILYFEVLRLYFRHFYKCRTTYMIYKAVFVK